jgi:hypothetical protein
MWRIRSLTETDNKGQPKYWSTDVGWTWKTFADTFTQEEKDAVMLPKHAVWEAITEQE